MIKTIFLFTFWVGGLCLFFARATACWSMGARYWPLLFGCVLLMRRFVVCECTWSGLKVIHEFGLSPFMSTWFYIMNLLIFATRFFFPTLSWSLLLPGLNHAGRSLDLRGTKYSFRGDYWFTAPVYFLVQCFFCRAIKISRSSFKDWVCQDLHKGTWVFFSKAKLVCGWFSALAKVVT